MAISVSQKLAGIRKRLAEMEGEAWGPESEIDTEHGEGEAGTGGAENVSDVNDVLIDYMLDIAAGIEDAYDLDSESAVDFVFDAADAVAEEGSLPFLPPEDDLVSTAEWIGKAKIMAFGDMVMAIADAQFGESA
jgi:hypothetical protein